MSLASAVHPCLPPSHIATDLTWFFRFRSVNCGVVNHVFLASCPLHSHILIELFGSIESVVRISGIAVYMLIRSPVLGLIAVCIVPFVAVINKKYGDWLCENAIAVQSALAEANSVAQEALSCVRTVISFAAEDFEYKKYTEKIDVQYKLNIRQVCHGVVISLVRWVELSI